MSNERIIKVVLISVGAIRRYSRWVWRVVECQRGQRGYANERGVRIIWESQCLYRPSASRGKGLEAYKTAVGQAVMAFRQALGEPCRNLKEIREIVSAA